MTTKKITLSIFFLTIFLSITSYTYSQADCANIAPFCANTAQNFPAETGNSAEAGPDYGCLASQPNPAWYYFQVAQTGNIIMSLNGTGGGDVDFIVWGPFANATGNCGNLTANNEVDCSFSASATETITIPNAVAGQNYIVLITNFSNQVQDIDFNQSGGTGTTNCGILTSGAPSTSICIGAVGTLSATSNIINPTYLWAPGGETTQSIQVSPSITSAYTVSISGINPVTSTQTTVVNVTTLTVVIPTITLSSNSMVCPNSPINLTASSGFTNYTWTSPVSTQTTAAGSLSIPNANPALAGTYTVIGRTAQGCTATATAVVDLIPTSPIAVTANPNACQGGVINLTANAPGATGYSWTGPLAYSSTLQNPVLNNVQPNQAGVYTVTATFSGTGPNTCTTTNTSTVSVVPAGTVLINPIADVCHNATINFTGPNGGTQYDWTGPAGFSSSLQNPSIANADVIHQGIYNLSITTNGCVNTGSVNVTVYNPLSFSSSPVNITLCAGKTGTIAAAGFGGSGTYNYQWTPATDLAAPNSPFTTVTGNTTITYTLTASDANCPVTIPVSVPVTVSVNPTPIITMSVSSQRGCEPHCVDLISISNPASASCVWRFTNNLGNNNCNVSNFCFPSRGNYNAWLSVTDVNGCVDSIQQNSFVVVDPVPLADFTWFPENPNILINEVSFTDQSSVGLPITDWRWSFGDYFANGADTSDLQNPSYVYDNVGTYPVTLGVTNSFGCISSVTKNMVIEDEFAIYIPNTFTPTKPEGKNDIFNVQGMGFRAEGFEMRIFDRWGNLIFKTNDVYKGWDGSIKGGPPVQGVYVYKIKVFDYKKREKEFVGYISAL